jgi:FtsP/CotA-like multicopper oxidase with cupredoxin domain
VSVPAGSVFTYVYRPRDPGTYMYHCHVEDTEHVHMGMTGMVFVHPKQDGTSYTYGAKTFTTFAYNDLNGSTGYDREFSMMLTEVWAESHWADAHIQLPEWSDYRADFSMINGRVHPDTLAPNAPLTGASGLPYHPVQFDAGGDLVAPAGRPDLNRQPLSALVECNAGDSVLLRFANLGFKEAAMTTAGVKMRVVGRDATPMKGRDGTDTSYVTNTINIGTGESYDVIVDAPAHSGAAGPDVYLVYNRNYQRSDNLAGGYGGQTTEIRVHPIGTLPAQQYPNY